MLAMISFSIWSYQLKNKKVFFNTHLLLIKIVCLYKRFNLCYNFIYINTLFNNESNCIKLPENKDNFNKGKNGFVSSKDEVDSNFPFNNNNMNLLEYIDSVCSEMFSSWVLELLMDVFILTQHVLILSNV